MRIKHLLRQYHDHWINNNLQPYLSLLRESSQGRKVVVDKTTGTTANGITNRRMMAYSVALGVTGKRKKRRQTLKALIVSAKGAGIERPTDTFDWNTWEYVSYS